MEVQLPHSARAQTPGGSLLAHPRGCCSAGRGGPCVVHVSTAERGGPLTETCLSSAAKQKGNKHAESKKCKQPGPSYSVLSKEVASRPVATSSCQPALPAGSLALMDRRGGAPDP